MIPGFRPFIRLLAPGRMLYRRSPIKKVIVSSILLVAFLSCDERSEPSPLASHPWPYNTESVAHIAPWKTILVNDVVYYRGFQHTARDTVRPDMKLSIPLIKHKGEIILDHYLWLNERELYT